MFPSRTKRTGARAHTALHAHFYPFTILDTILDFLEEVILVFRDGFLIQLAHDIHSLIEAFHW
jgi:hypothetical protein